MKFDDDAKLDTGQIDDQRGNASGRGSGRSSGGLPGIGGGMGLPKGKMGLGGMILIAIIFLIMAKVGGGGGNGTTTTQLGGTTTGQGDNTKIAETCKTGADANNRQDCRIVGVVNSAQKFWAEEFARNGQKYIQAPTTFFTGRVDTGCGPATSAVGPFYCPPDQKVYIDLDFYAELQSKFGAKGGPFAEAYVIAHEYGHHIQNLLGTNDQVKQGETGPNSGSVRLELQADCYAGVWAANATSGPNPLIVELTQEDIRLGIDAAASVGDDRIQKEMQGRINPESWTHGSSAQRQRWFLQGFNTGEPTQCDTFNTTEL